MNDKYTPIFNEVLDALCRTNLSPYETRTLMCIWRKTYGFFDKETGERKKTNILTTSQIAETCGLDRRNISVDLDTIDLDDPVIYKQVNSGRTVGLFQLEGEGMTELAKQVGIANEHDICDLIALYRPAILEANLHAVYVSNKKNEDQQIIHEQLKDITKNTHSIML